MKTRAAILVGLLWTVVAVNGCASSGPEPNRLGTARRLLLARVSSEENCPAAEAAAGLLLNAVRDAGSIVGAKEFVAEARALGLGFWAVEMLDRIQAVGQPTPEEGRVLREAFGITTLVMTEVTAFDQVWGKYAEFRRAIASTRRAKPAAASPSWYGDFLAAPEELMMLVEPVLDLAESRTLAGPPPSPGLATEARPTESVRDRHRAALSLLRAGTSPEEVARRERLLPGELRLMSNLVAAEAELAGARGR
jgi:hypothetical protein